METKDWRYKHGKSRSKVYMAWYYMMGRCYNEKNTKFYMYGGRGIRVAKNWHTFGQFYKDMGDVPKNKSLDRIDNSKNYSKSNCRWADVYTQMNNTRRNVFVNSRETIAQYARRMNLKYDSFYHYFKIKKLDLKTATNKATEEKRR